MILGYLAAGGDNAAILREFPGLAAEDVTARLNFARALASFEAVRRKPGARGSLRPQQHGLPRDGIQRPGQPNWHEHLLKIVERLPSDFEPYGRRKRNGSDCSCGCKHFLKLAGNLGMDWGVCANAKSPRCGLLTFEQV